LKNVADEATPLRLIGLQVAVHLVVRIGLRVHSEHVICASDAWLLKSEEDMFQNKPIRVANAFVVLTFGLLFSISSKAQLTVQGGFTAQQLAETIAGPGITVSNATINGSPQAHGTFNGGVAATGLNSGVILTTGPIEIALPPNNTEMAGVDLGLPGNPMLQGLAGATTYDAIVLEFDFVPLSNTAQFRYVFGSEEYPEFVSSGFNDAFAFFISGPGIAATYGVANYNMARVPGTAQPVTIDNVNANTNAQYYVSNWTGGLFGAPGNIPIQYDGLTTVLTATAQVQACQTYHLMMMIADAGDGIYDSGVFIEENSLISNVVQIEASTASADSIAYEGCTSATVTFTLDNVVAQPTVINYTVGGTATNGVDYNQIPNSVTIPANQSSTSFTVTPVNDGLVEGIETIIISVQTSVCGTDEIIIYIDDLVPLQVEAFGDTSFCPGGTAMLWATTSGGGGGTSLQWSNGMTTDTIYVSPTQATNYTVTASDFCGSGNPTSNQVSVTFDLLPLTLEVFSDTSICIGETVPLWYSATGGGGLSSLTWSNGATADTIYVSPATTTSYTVSGTGNCSAGVTDSDPVTVTVNPLPVANAGNDQTYCTGETVTLSGAGGATYEWFQLPAMTLVGSSATLQLTPSGDIDYLLVAHAGICNDSDMVSISELPADPISAIVGAPACPGGSVQLNVNGAAVGSTFAWTPAAGLSDAAIADPVAAVQSSTWFFVDVTSPNGCIGIDSAEVVILPLPVPSFTAPTACNNEATVFTNNSTITVGSIVGYGWNFGDGNSSNISSPSHLYDAEGTYPVTLVATSAAGCIDSVTQNVSVGPLPMASFTFQSDCQDKLIQFVDASTTVSGSIVQWFWDFDNQVVSDLQAPPMQQFPSAGFYDVSLTVATDLGCVHDTVVSVEIYPLPLADFMWDSVCLNLPNQFTDMSFANGSYPIDTYAWTFSNGQTSDVANPQVTFSTPGTHSATLTVTTTAGCQNTLTQSGAGVYPLPVAQFSNAIRNCLNDTTFFADLSTVQNVFNDVIQTRQWDFGDGYNSAMANPTHVYADYGFYPVTLSVTTDKGCTGDVTHDVEVFPLPMAAFGSDLRAGCQPLRIQFLDESTIPSPYSVASWQWDMGLDEDSITGQFPVQTYNDVNIYPMGVASYNVGLTVTSGNGCISSVTVQDYITEYPKPNAHFDASPKLVDMNNPTISFQDLSSINVIDWEWHFGDGATSFQQHTAHTYTDTADYPVTLFVATEYGCLDTAVYVVKVKPTFTFYIPNAFTPDSDGRNEYFFGQGTGIASYQMLIFNRWGEMLFESNDYDFHWDGRFRGHQVQVGVYVYKFMVTDWEGDIHYYEGHVNLMR